MTDESAPTTVTLVRHLAVSSEVDGRCYGQRLDPGLTDGPAPPAQFTALSALAHVATRYRSPAKRAHATAGFICDGAWSVDPSWAERDFGQWEGRRWDDCWADAPAAALTNADAYLSFTPPDAEPYDAVVKRVVGALEALPPGHHLIVTHAGPIRAALHSGCGWSTDQVFSATIDYGEVVRLDRIGDQGQAHNPDRWSARLGVPLAPPQ